MRRAPLWLLALLSLLGYCAVAAWFPLDPGLHQAPLPDIRTFTPSLGAGLTYGVWLVFLFALYGLACRHVWEGAGVPSLGRILLVTACFSLPLILTFPINATDVYRYFVRGRLTAVYHVSPFAVPPAAFPSDPFLALAGEWAGATSPYGPVWELVAGAVALVSGGQVQVALYLYKALGALLHLSVSAVIWLALRDAQPAQRAARTLLWAWNPALLLISVVDGHNDVLMLFWALLGALLVQGGNRHSSRASMCMGLIVMILAPLTKPIGLLPLPFFYLAVLRQLPDAKSRLRILGISGLGSMVILLLTLVPYASSVRTLIDLIPRLLQEAAGGAGYSPVTLVVLAARRLNLSLSLREAVILASSCYGLFILWSLWRTGRGASPVRATASLYAAYPIQAANFRIWYAGWTIPWLLCEKVLDTGWLIYGMGVLLTSQLSVLIYGHLRVVLFGGDHLTAHLLGVPFVFLVPAAAAWLWRRLWRRS